TRLIPSTRGAIDRYGFPEYHGMGNMVYAPRMADHVPSFKTLLDWDRSMSPWKGLTPAWDLALAHEIVPLAAETDLLGQEWNGDPWTTANLKRLPRGCALGHRSKDGSLIYALAERDYPEFFDTLPAPTRKFMHVGSQPVVIHGKRIEFTLCTRDPGGRRYSVYAPKTAREEYVLSSSVGKLGVVEITDEEFEQMMRQRK